MTPEDSEALTSEIAQWRQEAQRLHERGAVLIKTLNASHLEGYPKPLRHALSIIWDATDKLRISLKILDSYHD